jgi:hypothetical protein
VGTPFGEPYDDDGIGTSSVHMTVGHYLEVSKWHNRWPNCWCHLSFVQPEPYFFHADNRSPDRHAARSGCVWNKAPTMAMAGCRRDCQDSLPFDYFPLSRL